MFLQAESEGDVEYDAVGGGWPDYMRAWDEPRWSTIPSISSTAKVCPPLIVGDLGPHTLPPVDAFAIPVVTIFITSIVLSPLPKSFSKPGSGA